MEIPKVEIPKEVTIMKKKVPTNALIATIAIIAGVIGITALASASTQKPIIVVTKPGSYSNLMGTGTITPTPVGPLPGPI